MVNIGILLQSINYINTTTLISSVLHIPPLLRTSVSASHSSKPQAVTREVDTRLASTRDFGAVSRQNSGFSLSPREPPFTTQELNLYKGKGDYADVLDEPLEEHMQSEDAEDMVQPLKDGEERIYKHSKQEFHSRRTKVAFESISTHEKNLSSITATKTSEFSGNFQFPLSFQKAEKFELVNYYDGVFTHPESNERVTLKDAVLGDLLDAEECTFLVPTNKRRLALKEAFRLKLLTENGYFESLDDSTCFRDLIDQKFVNIHSATKNEAGLAENLLEEVEEEEDEEEAYKRSDAADSGKLYAVVAVIDPDTKKSIDAFTAVQRGVLDQANATYNVFDASGHILQIPIDRAIDTGLVQVDEGYLSGSHENEKLIHETKTFDVTGMLDPINKRHIPLHEAIKHGYIDQNQGTFYNVATRKTMPIIEAIGLGHVVATVLSSDQNADPYASSKIMMQKEVAFVIKNIIDPETGKKLTIHEAIRLGIFNPTKGEFKDKKTGRLLSLDEAVDMNFINIEEGRPDGDETSREEKVSSLHIDDEMEAREEMAREEITEERRTFQITQVKDAQSDTFVTFMDAIYMGLINEETGMYLNNLTGQKLTIIEALTKGFIHGVQQSVDHQELFKSDVVARKKDEILSVFDPISMTEISAKEALQMGLLSKDLKRYFNPASNQYMLFDEAVKKYLIKLKDTRRGKKDSDKDADGDDGQVTRKTRVSIDWSGGRVMNKDTHQAIPLNEALKHGLIEESVASVLRLKHPEEESKTVVAPKKENDPILMKMVIQMKFMRDASGRIVIRDQGSKTKSQASKYGGLKSSSGLSFHDAVRLGLYSMQRGLYYDPHTKRKFTLFEAISAGLLNTKQPALVDITNGKKLTLKEMLSADIIDSNTGKVMASQLSSLRLTLDPVFFGLHTPSMNLEDAIRCKLFDDETGLFNIPFTDRNVDLSTAIEMGYVAGRANIVLNPVSGERCFLDQALKNNVIDNSTARFVDSTVEKNITLSRAILLGLIKHAYLNNCSFIMECQTGELVSLEAAVDGKYIDFNFPSVYDVLLKKRVPLKTALNSGLIDRISKQYINKADGTETALKVASKCGLITLPGAPILAKPEKSSQDVVQTQLHTNVTLNKGAKLQEKITESFGPSHLPPLEISKDTKSKFKRLSSNPIEVSSVRDDDNKKISESKFYDTIIDDLPLETNVTEDGSFVTSKKTVTKVNKAQAKETVENFSDHNALQYQPAQAIQYTPVNATPYKEVKSDDYQPQFAQAQEPVEVAHYEAKVENRFKPRVPSKSENVGRTMAPTYDNFVVHPETGEQVSTDNALERGLIKINWETGNIINISEKTLMSSREAYEKGFIDLHIKDLIENRAKNPHLSSLTKITLNEALTNKLIIIPLSKIKDPSTSENISLQKAIESNLIDTNRSVLLDPATQQPRSLTDLIDSNVFDVYNAAMKNSKNGKVLMLAEIIFQGFLPEDGLPVATDQYSEVEAINDGLLNPSTRDFTEPKSKIVVSEKVAKEVGYIEEVFNSTTLINALRNNLICHRTLIFTHPTSGDNLDLKEAILAGYIVVPKKDDVCNDVDAISFQTALHKGYIDIQKAIFTDPITEAEIPFDTAIRNGWILLPTDEEDTCQFTRFLEFKDLPLSFEDTIVSGLYDENSGLFIDPYSGSNITLEEALASNLVDPASCVRSPATGQEYTLQNAINSGFLDFSSGRLIDLSANKSIDMNEALYRELVVNSGPCLWIGIPFIDYLKTSGKVSVFDHSSEKYVPLQSAINLRLLDFNEDYYWNNKTNAKFTLKEAAQRRFILIEKFKVQQEDMIDFKITQALDTARNNWITPSNALRAGILNMNEKLYYDTKENEYLSLLEALNGGKIMVESIEGNKEAAEKTFSISKVFDAASNAWMPPHKAEMKGLIEMTSEVYSHSLHNEKMSLEEAMKRGHIEAEEVTDIDKLKSETVKAADISEVLDYTTGEKLTLNEAIDKKLVDTSGCFYIDPRDGSKLSLYEAWQKGYIKLKSDDLFAFKSKMITSVLDPRTGEEIPIADAMRHQIVDKVGGKYWNMKTNAYMDLDFAISKGLVLVESADRAMKKFARVEIESPFESEAKVYMINTVRIPGSEEELDAVEAERRGFINKVQGTYMYPLTGEKISIKNAIKRNFILASVVEDPDYDALQQNEAAYAILESDKLLSEISSVVDARTGEQVSVFEGIRRGLIDLKSKLYYNEKTGERLPIYKAVQQNLVLGSATNEEAKASTSRKLYLFKVAQSGGSSGAQGRNKGTGSTKLGGVKTTGGHLTLKEAMAQGLIDQKNNIYHDPATRESFPLDEAIQKGFLFIDNLSSFDGNDASKSSLNSITNTQSFTNKSKGALNSHFPFVPSPENQADDKYDFVSGPPKMNSLDRLLVDLEQETKGRQDINIDSGIYSQPVKPKIVSPSDFNTFSTSSRPQAKCNNHQVKKF